MKTIAGAVLTVAAAVLLGGCASPGAKNDAAALPADVNDGSAQAATATAKPAADAAGATLQANVVRKEGDQGIKAGGKKNEPAGARFRVKQLTINSDTLRFNKDTSEALFSGNVAAEAANVLIYSDELRSKNYRDNAQATGNIRAVYKEQNVVINCGRMDYKEKLTKVYGYDNVVARKVMADGNTMTMKCDEIEFDADSDVMYARRVSNRVRVTMQDIMAFADNVRYDDRTKEMELTGKPLLKKKKSVFLSDNIKLDVEKKLLKMKDNIFTRLFAGDVEGAKTRQQGEGAKTKQGGKP